MIEPSGADHALHPRGPRCTPGLPTAWSGARRASRAHRNRRL